MTEHTQTLKYYDDNAQSFIDNTINVDMLDLYARFEQRLPQGTHARILDLGCGSGRDSIYFASLGHKITAIDGSQKLIDLAKNTACKNFVQHLNITRHCLRFNEIAMQPWKNHFDGIWACASLLHVPYAELPDLLTDLLNLLKPDGVLYASFKYGDSERVDDGRFFCDMDEDRWTKVKEIIRAKHFDISDEEIWLTQDKRTNRTGMWFNVVFTV